ncbi:MAG: hypothetical protein EPGJADBJ_03502 [Saprospiraceae bacterium]|nr:hypothetical protein [Saprospiraceae bacterium]
MVEDSFRKAEFAAAQFFQTLVKRTLLMREKNDFVNRNHHFLIIDDAKRFTQKMAIPFYVSAGLVQSIFLYNMLDAAFFADMENGKFWYNLLCVLAGIAPIGCSLWAGNCFLQIQPKADPVVPGRLHYHRGWLASFLIISFVYLGFVVLLTKFNSNPGEYDLIIVPVLAVVELILGVPAVEGLNALALFWNKRNHIKGLLDNSAALLKWAGKCATAYRHYLQYRILFNKQHPENQIDLLTSPQIERAIQYFKGYWNYDNHSLTDCTG